MMVKGKGYGRREWMRLMDNSFFVSMHLNVCYYLTHPHFSIFLCLKFHISKIALSKVWLGVNATAVLVGVSVLSPLKACCMDVCAS